MTARTDIKQRLQETLPTGRVSFRFDDKPEYTKDAMEQPFLPDALFFAQSEEDLIMAVDLCRELHIPLIIRGAGTGYTGGALAVSGGLLVSIERMNDIAIDPDKRLAIAGPGAITADIMRAAEKHGLFYPPDPASFEDSTIGGNLAENAGGLRCKKYGVTKDYVVAVRGITTAGDIIDVDAASPFGLTDVFIGSEGTLLAFTRITLRLIDLPRPGRTILAVFANAVDAASVVSGVTASGIVPCIMEFMDRGAIRSSNRYDPAHTIEEGAAMLLFETDGPHAADEAIRIKDICAQFNPVTLREAVDAAERDILWQTRRNLSKAVKSAVKSKIAEDVCVPPSRLPELVAYTEELAARFTIGVNCYGHAGDGNLHVNFLGMTGSDLEEREIKEGIALLFSRTLALGGTLTGEHGIGIAKKDFLAQEFDTSTISFMARLKKCLDPQGFFNPGKIFL